MRVRIKYLRKVVKDTSEKTKTKVRKSYRNDDKYCEKYGKSPLKSRKWKRTENADWKTKKTERAMICIKGWNIWQMKVKGPREGGKDYEEQNKIQIIKHIDLSEKYRITKRVNRAKEVEKRNRRINYSKRL